MDEELRTINEELRQRGNDLNRSNGCSNRFSPACAAASWYWIASCT
jgi:hypothetical protein